APAHRRGGERRDRALAEAHRERGGIQALAVAAAAALGLARIPLVPPALLAALLRIEAGHLDARAEAVLAPAVLGVEGKQARIEFAEAAAAVRAGALGREHRDAAALRSQHVHQPLAEVERAR